MVMTIQTCQFTFDKTIITQSTWFLSPLDLHHLFCDYPADLSRPCPCAAGDARHGLKGPLAGSCNQQTQKLSHILEKSNNYLVTVMPGTKKMYVNSSKYSHASSKRVNCCVRAQQEGKLTVCEYTIHALGGGGELRIDAIRSFRHTETEKGREKSERHH